MADNKTLIIVAVVVMMCCCCVSSSIAGGLYMQTNKKDTATEEEDETITPEDETITPVAMTTTPTTPVAATITPVVATTTLTWNKTPKNKVQGGQEGSRKLYVCQGKQEGNWHPGKTADDFGDACNIPWGGKELQAKEINYLDSDKKFTWSKNPKNKVQGGQEGTRKLYVCQGKKDGNWHPGKTTDGWDGCLIGWGGKEMAASEMNYLGYD